MGNDNFSFKRDFKKIMWLSTLWVNFLRSLFAGPVFLLIMFFVDDRSNSLLPFLMFPVAYFLCLLPFGIFLYILNDMGVPFAGYLYIFFSILVALGDPFVFILHKIKPSFVPVYKFNMFNFDIIIFVTNDNIKLAERM